MTTPPFDDETLMAYVDGELDTDAAQAVEQAMQTDERIAVRVEAFRRSAALAKLALATDLETPVPAALHAAVRAAVERAAQNERDGEAAKWAAAGEAAARSADVQSLPIPERARRRWFTRAANQPSFALAASAAAIAFGFLGYLAGTMQGDAGAPMVATGLNVTGDAREQVALVAMLNELPSGQQRRLAPVESAANLELVATFRDRTGALCREFKLQRAGAGEVLGVACRTEGDWAVTFATATAAGTGFAPASSAATLDAYLTSIEAGPALNRAEEQAALAGRHR